MNLAQLRIAMFRARAGQRLSPPDLTPVPEPGEPPRYVSGEEFDRTYLELGSNAEVARRLGITPGSVSDRALRRGLRERRA